MTPAQERALRERYEREKPEVGFEEWAYELQVEAAEMECDRRREEGR